MNQDPRALAAFELMMSKQSDAALAAYNQLIKDQPDEPRHYMNRALVFDMLKRKEDAIADASKALSLASLPWMKDQIQDLLEDLK
jgi:tetratricopeptide (TPR) repeat protein